MMNTPFCILPWFHQVVDPNGSIKPCCIWNGPTDKTSNSTDYIQSEFMENLRGMFKNDIPHEQCNKCIYAESINGISIRKDGFDTANKLKLTFAELDANPKIVRSQDVGLSNVCNLKCRMCNQTKSTKWIADAVAMGDESAGLLESNWSLSTEQVLSIERLRFPGGEPMLHQDIIVNELTKLKDANRLHLLELHFTTNMTVELTPELVNLITNTKYTYIMCSIDGVGSMNDYIRSDSDWETIVANMNTLASIRNNCSTLFFGLTPVYNVFNAAQFEDLVIWGSQYDTWITPSMQRSPMIQDACNLPDDYKHELISHYNLCKHKHPTYLQWFDVIIEHLKSNRTLEFDVWKQKFKAHNNFLDQRRQTNLADVNMRLAVIINE